MHKFSFASVSLVRCHSVSGHLHSGPQDTAVRNRGKCVAKHKVLLNLCMCLIHITSHTPLAKASLVAKHGFNGLGNYNILPGRASRYW